MPVADNSFHEYVKELFAGLCPVQFNAFSAAQAVRRDQSGLRDHIKCKSSTVVD